MPAAASKSVSESLANVPDPDEIRRRITQNIEERQTLRQLLRLAERLHRKRTRGNRS